MKYSTILSVYTGTLRKFNSYFLQCIYELEYLELLDTRDRGIELTSSSKVRFKEMKLNSEIHIKSPFVRVCNLWKK